MQMIVKIVKRFPETEKVKAIAKIEIDNSFVVHGFKVIDSENGLFVAMPSIKLTDKHKDIFHPISKEARTELFDAILSAYFAE